MSIKNYNLKDWITGYTLGLAGKPLPISVTKKEPVAYLYNGARLPKLPEWEGYAVILDSAAYLGTYLLVSSTPFYVSDGKLVNDAGDGGVVCKLIDDSWTVSTYTVNYALEVAEIAPGTLNALLWSNHNVTSGGDTHLEASEPVPIYPGWQVMFEGEITTKESTYAKGAFGSFEADGGIENGATVRTTIDGESFVTVKNGSYVGNTWLAAPPLTEVTDDGGDYCWAIFGGSFYTRYPGTYQVKIEHYVE